ncbi:MAG: type III-B CRISPR module RAMP protein Cmr4 [Dysgonamonadaceae bacterium]|jgi:CRISPR-associated protein Cmr4|nr:type III-B CRISPR module RAMP protein Cmr4 [Dysgonamonadaceae bacterium]
MENKVWLITTKTNLHVGNENTSNYGLIDKSVQRDVLTGLPCINGSSLKGALNEFFAVKKTGKINLVKVFGADKMDNSKDKETRKGEYSFLDAQLLSIPVQSNNRLFYRATSPGILKKFVEQLNLFGIKYDAFNLGFDLSSPIVFTEDGTKLGDFDAKKEIVNDTVKRIEELIGKDIAIFNDEYFKELCGDDNLPIIARNKLDNGKSENLWYEQALPQETIFYSLFLSLENDITKEILSGEIVQIGANATIGFGYCQFKQL